MLTVLSINNSPTFQLSKEHIRLNIDRGDKSPLFFWRYITGANSGCSPGPSQRGLGYFGSFAEVSIPLQGLQSWSADRQCPAWDPGLPAAITITRGATPLLSSPTESLVPKPEVWESLDKCRGHKTI